DASEESIHSFVLARLFERAVDPLANPAVALEVIVDISLRFLGIDPELLRQSKGRNPIHDPKIYGLGAATVLGIDHHGWNAKDFARSQLVNIAIVLVGIHQQTILREMRKQAQLDLGIIGRKEHATGLGNERRADLAANLGANRNILQIWID